MVCRGALAPPLALPPLSDLHPSSSSPRPSIYQSRAFIFFLGGGVELEGWSDSRTNSSEWLLVQGERRLTHESSVQMLLQPTYLKCWNLSEYLELRPNNFQATTLVTSTSVSLTFWLKRFALFPNWKSTQLQRVMLMLPCYFTPKSFQFKNSCSCKDFQVSRPHSGIGSQANNMFRSACRVDKNMDYNGLYNVQHTAYKLVFTRIESDTILTCYMFRYWSFMWKLDFNIPA